MLRLAALSRASANNTEEFLQYLDAQSLETKVKEAQNTAERAGEEIEERESKTTKKRKREYIPGTENGEAVVVTAEEFLDKLKSKNEEKKSKEEGKKKRKREDSKGEKKTKKNDKGEKKSKATKAEKKPKQEQETSWKSKKATQVP